MHVPQQPVVKDLVLVGGGHSHVAVLKRFGMSPMPGVRLTVICRDVHTPYSGMLPGISPAITGSTTPISIWARSAASPARASSATRRPASTCAASRCICRDRPPVPYDLLSHQHRLDAAHEPRCPAPPAHVVPVKPINGFSTRWEALRARVRAPTARCASPWSAPARAASRSCSPCSTACARNCAQAGRTTDEIAFHLFSAAPRSCRPTMRGCGAASSGCWARGVSVVPAQAAVAQVSPDSLRTAAARNVAADEILWVTRGRRRTVAAPSRARARCGRLHPGRRHAAVAVQPDVFAAGDIAAMVNHPRPKSGVFAVRQGQPLAATTCAAR